MKKESLKIILILLIIFSFTKVKAMEVGKIGVLVNRCVLNKNNEVSIPIKVIGLNNGLLSNKILEYELGMIDNDTYLYNVSIQNVNGQALRNIIIDEKQDSDKKSKVLYYLGKDVNLTEMKEVFNFSLVYKLKKPIEEINVLGNTIYVSENDELCSKINNGSYIENKELSQIKTTNKSQGFNFVWIVAGISFLINVILIIYIKTNE
mgnify:FL=1